MDDPAAVVPASSDSRKALARLCAAAFLAYCSYAICRTPLLPLFARSLGADAPMIGFVVGASTLTGIALKLPAGTWSDVLGRRPLLVAGALVFALLPFTYLGVASLGALIALRFVHGAATAIFGPVASASLSDIAPATRRATWLSTYSTVQGVGQALGPIVAGYLIVSGRFDLAFVAAGTIALAAPLVVFGWPRARTPRRDAHPMRLFARGVSEIVRERLVLVTSGAQAAQFVLNGTLNAFLPLFGRDVLGLPLTHLGWVFGLQTVTTLMTRPIMGALSDRLGRRGLIVAGLTVCGAAVIAVSFATSLSTLLPAVVFYAIGVAVTTASTSAFITDLAPRAQYGAAHGVFGTIYDVGDALGPIAAGLLVASVGYARTFRMMAGVVFVAALMFFIMTREKARSTMRVTAALLMVAVASTAVVYAQTRKVDFEQDAIGQPPKGFQFGHTTKAGAPGKWVVQQDAGNKYLAQLDPDRTRTRFPVAVMTDLTAVDVDVSMRIKPVSGRVDQAAGLVWRYQNEDDYYIVRANALEGNVVLYKVEKGKRTDLPLKGEGRTYGRSANVPSGQWSTLRVTATGSRFEVFFNGQKLYEVEDSTFTQPGKVGVWTKADSVTHFDDLTVATK